MLAKREDMILDELVSIVGKANATAAKHIRYAYSYDLSFVKPKLPDYVVMATSVEQVQNVLKLANREKIPVIPYTAGSNIGGLCIPEQGGILLDLKRMNKIIRIDTERIPCPVGDGVVQEQPEMELAGGTAVRFGLIQCLMSRYWRSERQVRPE